MSETLEQKVERLEEELNAAVVYARTESDRAKSVEHWKKLAEAENRRGHELKWELYEILKAEGYHVRSYSELVAPRGGSVIVDGDKRAPGEYHVIGAVKHLIERAKRAEAGK